MAKIGDGRIVLSGRVPYALSVVALFKGLARAIGGTGNDLNYEHSILLHDGAKAVLNGLELPPDRFWRALEGVGVVRWAQVEPGVISQLRYFPYDSALLELKRHQVSGWDARLTLQYVKAGDSVCAQRHASTLATFVGVIEPATLLTQDDGAAEQHLLPLAYA